MKNTLDINKIKEKYHEKFRKNINHKKPYFEQLLERAWKEYDNHPAFNPNIRTKEEEKKAIMKDREELKALNELIKLYNSRVSLKKVEYCDC